MDVLASEIITEPPWVMLLSDDQYLCDTSQAALERERTGDMARPIRKSWTESQPNKNSVHAMPCKDYDNNFRNYEDIQQGDDTLSTVITFKYLGLHVAEMRMVRCIRGKIRKDHV